MTEEIDVYLTQKALDNLKDKYFDEYAKELQMFREFPIETQVRVYFEYWFLLKKLTKQKIRVEQFSIEKSTINIQKEEMLLARLLNYISSNGCISVFSLHNSRGIFDLTNFINIDFNYFNKANPTHKIGKFTTEEIFTTISNPEENAEIIEKMYALVVFLKEQLTPKK